MPQFTSFLTPCQILCLFASTARHPRPDGRFTPEFSLVWFVYAVVLFLHTFIASWKYIRKRTEEDKKLESGDAREF
jgi:hypothetical protein